MLQNGKGNGDEGALGAFDMVGECVVSPSDQRRVRVGRTGIEQSERGEESDTLIP
jgi:hypothetical protein